MLIRAALLCNTVIRMTPSGCPRSASPSGGRLCGMMPALANAVARLRAGNWPDRGFIRTAAAALLAIELAVSAFMVAGTHGWIVPLAKPTGTDFVSFYAAGALANRGTPEVVYNLAARAAAEEAATEPGVPFALAAGRCWSALAAAAVSVAALALVSLAMFGSDTWHDFFVTAGAAHAPYETDWAPFYAFANPYGAVRQLGGSVPFAYALQGLTTLFAAALVVVVWRRALPLPTRAAVLAAATPIAVPVSLYQDLMLDAIAGAWLIRECASSRTADGKRPRWPASTSWHYTLGTWPSTGPCRFSRSPRQP